MTYGRLNDIVSGPTSTIEALGRSIQSYNALDMIIAS